MICLWILRQCNNLLFQVSTDEWIVNQSMCLLVKRLRFTACTMSMGAAIAPMPLSPHANVFFTGSITVPPSCCNIARCVAVKGLSHMKVFMAGATCEANQRGGILLYHCCSHYKSRWQVLLSADLYWSCRNAVSELWESAHFQVVQSP